MIGTGPVHRPDQAHRPAPRARVHVHPSPMPASVLYTTCCTQHTGPVQDVCCCVQNTCQTGPACWIQHVWPVCRPDPDCSQIQHVGLVLCRCCMQHTSWTNPCAIGSTCSESRPSFTYHMMPGPVCYMWHAGLIHYPQEAPQTR